MALSGWAIVILIAGFLLGPTGPSAQAAGAPPQLGQTPATCVIELAVVSRPLSSPLNVSSFFPRRIRRKAVLESAHPQLVEETDLGPILIPDPFGAPVPSGPNPTFLSTRPLRC